MYIIESFPLYNIQVACLNENIVALLNQSLSLVAEAKRAKIAKLRHERRLRELRVEMDRLTKEVRQEEFKLNSMKPHLGKSNQFLISLKKKRRDLLHSANKLGKTIKGDDYSLINKAGAEINAKSKMLQAEIKLVNALKPDNIEQLLLSQNKETEATKPKHTTQVQANTSTTIKNIATYSKKRCLTEDVENTYSDICNQTSEAEVQKEIPTEGKQKPELQIYPALDVDGQIDDDCRKSEEVLQTMLSYTSPLEHLKNAYGYLDFNAILCPYEMWGKCADNSCIYFHMTVEREKGSELVKPFKHFL